MRSAWPHQRENDPNRHCVATVLPHNAMFSLTFAGVASVDLSEPPFCNVLSFAVFRRYSAACHTTSYSGENGLVWYGPHDLIVGHAGRGMIFVRCSRSGSGENGEIFRLVACRVLRLTPRKDLPVGSVAAAERWARLDAEERSRLSRIRESRLRQSQDSMLADAEQWRRLFDTGVTSDSPEAQRLAAQIMDKNIKAKAAKAQVPQDAEEQAAMPFSDTLGVVRSALCGDPRFADPCGAALYGSKACADFANEATRIHVQRLAQQLERQLDQRPASS